MRVLDPGHVFELAHLDGDGIQQLRFVKREGIGYPGNVGHHEGTNLQEVIRALIARLGYVDSQLYDDSNLECIEHLRECIRLLETRAAIRHGRSVPIFGKYPEILGTCSDCGHIGCWQCSAVITPEAFMPDEPPLPAAHGGEG